VFAWIPRDRVEANVKEGVEHVNDNVANRSVLATQKWFVIVRQQALRIKETGNRTQSHSKDILEDCAVNYAILCYI